MALVFIPRPDSYSTCCPLTGTHDSLIALLSKPRFAEIGAHPRGELLTGLADGWSRLGDTEKARSYFERIETELRGTVYEQKAKAWLENKPEAKAPGFFNCSGCHVK